MATLSLSSNGLARSTPNAAADSPSSRSQQRVPQDRSSPRLCTAQTDGGSAARRPLRRTTTHGGTQTPCGAEAAATRERRRLSDGCVLKLPQPVSLTYYLHLRFGNPIVLWTLKLFQ